MAGLTRKQLSGGDSKILLQSDWLYARMYLAVYAMIMKQTYKEVRTMKEGIHPAYYEATVTCNCGNTFTTGSTKKDIHVEICSKCHPFYTGQQKAAQARGRIEAFNKKYGMAGADAQ